MIAANTATKLATRLCERARKNSLGPSTPRIHRIYEGENKLIVQLIKPQVLSYFYSDDFNYLENQFRSNFKDFYKDYYPKLPIVNSEEAFNFIDKI
jgi:hypothetical protein